MTASAQTFTYCAFGDSITEGKYDNQNLGGYPGRLENDADLLDCTPATCDVINEGKGGERTAAGVTRIDQVLAAGTYDVLLLMEGTNDIFKPTPISTETITFNLATIASKAASHGVETIHASIIWFHPEGKHGTSRDALVEALRNSVANLASANQRSFADAWSLLCPEGQDIHGHNQPTCFNKHYFGDVPDNDPVGHPKGSGYTMLADLFYEVITAVPAPGAPTPTAPVGDVPPGLAQLAWARESPARATWYRVVVEAGPEIHVDRWLPASGNCTPSTCTYSLAEPLAPGDYTWRVRGRNPAGFGPWSADASIRVLIFIDGFESGDTNQWDRG
jgi:lysophospholipase L1-like esterase